MKLLGIYTSRTHDLCLESIGQIKDLELDYDTRDAEFFSASEESGIELLENHTHFIVSVFQEDLETSWFNLICGYALGSGKPLFLVGNNLRGFIVNLFPSGNISSFFRMEKDKYLFEESIRIAKAELAKSGIAFHADAFCQAVSEGALKAVELFLAAGFSPDARNTKGVSAISLAIRGQHRSIVQLLLQKGVDINVVSDDRGNTPVMDAAACGDNEMVKVLIKSGADLNAVSKNGQTALILAVGQDNEDTALTLIRAGADMFIQDSLGMSAAAYAKMFGKNEILKHINEA